MALCTELRVKRPDQAEITSTNVAEGQESQHAELDENDIYGAKLMKTSIFSLKWKRKGGLSVRNITHLNRSNNVS